MGNASSTSSPSMNVFEKELKQLNYVINNVLTDDNIFKQSRYNFLTQDVCNNYIMIMEEELNKHLKVQLQDVGKSLVLIPRSHESKVNKKEICKMISGHYMKILYILTLIKYVYNVEKHGDFSISGIIFRNVKIVDNIMEISFCNVPHKDYTRKQSDGDDKTDVYKIDFGKLEGLQFLNQYFLKPEEAQGFIKMMKTLLAKGSKYEFRNAVCDAVQYGSLNLKEFESMYAAKYGERLSCKEYHKSKTNKAASSDGVITMNKKVPSLLMKVDANNSVFHKDYCYEIRSYVIPLHTKDGKRILDLYNRMKSNYDKNIAAILAVVDKLVQREPSGIFNLREISKTDLDTIIDMTKSVIKTYYVQSILDYQILLDEAKTVKNLNIKQ